MKTFFKKEGLTFQPVLLMLLSKGSPNATTQYGLLKENREEYFPDPDLSGNAILGPGLLQQKSVNDWRNISQPRGMVKSASIAQRNKVVT